jgi:divalent metal cation (Fe/Co/Zn/Cd) transporter
MDPLVNLQVLDELRTEIISIVIRHEVWKMLIDLINDFVDQRLLCQT